MSTFISYSRADSSFAVRLAKNLKSAGFDVWLDQLDIPTGARWDDEVETALESCKTFMIILSPESLESQNVKDEIGYAIDSGKEILPVKIKSGEIPFRLRRFQYVDFSNQSYQESLKEIKSLLSEAGNTLTGNEAEKEQVEAEGAPTVSKIKAISPEPVSHPTKPILKRPEAVRSPVPRTFISRGLLIGAGAVTILLFAAGIVLSVLQKNRTPAATATTKGANLQVLPTDPSTLAPTAAAADVSTQTQDGPSGAFLANFLNSSALGDWDDFILGVGKKTKAIVSPSSDGLRFRLGDRDLRAYYLYEPVIYEDVSIRMLVENLGQNTNFVSLVCRRTGDAWYEFRIEAASLWQLFQYDGEYNRLANGGTMYGKSGKEINEYEMRCIGSEISLSVNGQTVSTYPVNREVYRQGQVGLSISTEEVFPIDIRVIEFEVSEVTPGSSTAVSTSPSGTDAGAGTPASNTESTPAAAEGDRLTSPKDGMQMLYVPEGEFSMGTDNGEPEESPAHTVFLDAFWIDQTEVTNKMFANFLNAQTEQSQIPDWVDTNDEDLQVQRVDSAWQAVAGYADYPVIEVKWAGAAAYCAWRGEGTRLPTEAEWEKAARGTTDNLYAWGNDIDCSLANYGTCEGSTVRVGSYPSSASPYGALDMTGNVVEWVLDWYAAGYYQKSPAANPTGPASGEQRVLRGGSWDEQTDYQVRVTFRYTQPPDDSLDDGGFRCALPE